MKNNKDILVDAIGKIDDQYIKEAHEVKKKFVFDWAFVGKVLTTALCLFLVITIIPSFFRMGSQAKTADAYYIADSANGTYGGIGGVGGKGGSGSYEAVNSSEFVAEEDALKAKAAIDNKKLIVTGSINIETMDFDGLLESINKSVEEYGAYIQYSSTGTNYNQSRNYNATIRIPADKYDDFLGQVKAIGNVTWYNENKDDVTEEYFDLEARQNSLKAEEAKVLEFYNKATDLSELMMVEDRLTEIRYQIDSIETRIKNYDLLTTYSTLNVSVVETKAYTQTNDDFFSRISLSFRNGFTNFVYSVEDLIIDLVYNIWTIIIIGIVIVVGVIVFKKIKNKRNR